VSRLCWMGLGLGLPLLAAIFFRPLRSCTRRDEAERERARVASNQTKPIAIEEPAASAPRSRGQLSILLQSRCDSVFPFMVLAELASRVASNKFVVVSRRRRINRDRAYSVQSPWLAVLSLSPGFGRC